MPNEVNQHIKLTDVLNKATVKWTKIGCQLGIISITFSLAYSENL